MLGGFKMILTIILGLVLLYCVIDCILVLICVLFNGSSYKSPNHNMSVNVSKGEYLKYINKKEQE